MYENILTTITKKEEEREGGRGWNTLIKMLEGAKV